MSDSSGSSQHSESAVDYCNRLKVLLLLERMGDHLLSERPAEPIDALAVFLKANWQRLTMETKPEGSGDDGGSSV
jgi:hypothetical protein